MVVWFVWFDTQYLMYMLVPRIQDFKNIHRTWTITLFRTCPYNIYLVLWGIMWGITRLMRQLLIWWYGCDSMTLEIKIICL